jgi:D-alanyl-D-alanine carboxypeptidase
MCRALVTEKGYNVYIDNNGGYRSYATQDALYKKYPQTAVPAGQSDHNSGYGINMAVFMNGSVYSFSSSNEACRTILAWVNANAHKYGFVRRYDPAKASQTGMTAGLDDWHYRYVGEAHAYYMKQNNLCLEEYIAVLENYYAYGQNHLKFTTDTGKKYEIYFVARTGDNTAVPVPTGKNYTVSGNNHSGFIVTIEA